MDYKKYSSQILVDDLGHWFLKQHTTSRSISTVMYWGSETEFVQSIISVTFVINQMCQIVNFTKKICLDGPQFESENGLVHYNRKKFKVVKS